MPSRAATSASVTTSEKASVLARIPSLDGLRAVSICLVLFGHAAGTRNFFPREGILAHASGFASLGVRSFFVISGFLITSLLLQEHELTGKISLGKFYLRRIFRIMPAAYAFMAAMGLLHAFGVIPFTRGQFVHALTYTTNYSEGSWYLGHLWSLSAEEQFYAVWPPLLVWVGVRKGAAASAWALVLVPVLRMAVYFLLPAHRQWIPLAFPTIADCMASGCLLAFWSRPLSKCAPYIRFLESRMFWAVPAVVIGSAVFLNRPMFAYSLGYTLNQLAITVCIDRCIRYPSDWTGRVLNHRTVAHVGVLSYSLYLWQQPFFNPNSSMPVTAFPLNLVLASSLAVVSYRMVERPFLRFRARLMRAE